MSKHRSGNDRARDAPGKQIRTALVSPEWYRIFVGDGDYVNIWRTAEVRMCAHIYADMVSNMTLHLMHNTDAGDERVVNALSRKIDIEPNRYMNRKQFIYNVVYTLMTSGEGNCVVYPTYTPDGMIDELIPLHPSAVSFVADGYGYKVRYGQKVFAPDEVLHFAINPDPEQPWRGTGVRVELKDVVKCIRQANATKTALLESPAPSLIVKVDGLTEEFATVEGRKRLSAQYLDARENGRPWFIPSEAFSVETVKPMTVADLAIAANLELDRRSVAAVYGVPPFIAGVGAYSEDENNNFINLRIMGIAQYIAQELTRKLLYSPDYYWRFNNRSLYNYKLTDLITAGGEMVDRMAMTRNELRDWVGLVPREGMDELLALENYIPADKLGEQKKLQGGGE